MNISRTCFKKEIITEFVPSRRKNSKKVMIFCGGVPGVPHKDDVLDFFSKRGYWTFFPRYRGTWESRGVFLKTSPEEDILDVIDSLKKPFKDFWSGARYQIEPREITIVGSSFGGPAAILATRDERVKRAVCISPVVDWEVEDKNDPLEHLYHILKEAYGDAYRLNRKTWNKLKGGKFYNPVRHVQDLSASKISILHAKNDDVVRPRSVIQFSKKLKCELILLKSGGHLSSSILMNPRFLKKLHL